MKGILIISPHHAIDGLGDFRDLFIGAEDKSKKLAKYYQEVCQCENCHFLDAATIIQPSKIDGLHFDETGHLSLGKATAKIISEIFEKK